MSETKQENSVIDPKTENLTVLKLAGGTLFFLGLLSFAMAKFAHPDLSLEKVNMVLYTTVLLSMGYPALLYVRSLSKISLLEKRIEELEKKSS